MNRLKNDKGTTLLVALLVFAVCAVVGTIILVTASTASGRTGGLQSENQSCYTCTSAARTMKAILQDTTCEIEEKDNGDLEIKVNYSQGKKLLPPEFNSQVLKVYKALGKNSNASNSSKFQTLPLTIDFHGDSSLDLTDAKFKISKDEDSAYNITIDFAKKIDGKTYNCCLFAPAVVTENNEIMWLNNGQIVNNVENTNLSNCTKVDYKVTTITWPDVTIRGSEVYDND